MGKNKIEDLRVAKERIGRKYQEFNELLAQHQQADVGLREKKRVLLTEVALGNEQAETQLKRVEGELNSTRSTIEDIGLTLSGLSEKEAETDKGIRIAEQAEKEGTYLKAEEVLSDLHKKIVEIAGIVVMRIDELYELVQEFPRLRQTLIFQIEAHENFMHQEGITAISKRLSLEELEKDRQSQKSIDKKLLEASHALLDIVNTGKLRTVAAMLDTTPLTFR